MWRLVRRPLAVAALGAAALAALGCGPGDKDPGVDAGTVLPPPDTAIAWKPGTAVLFTPVDGNRAPRLMDALYDGTRVLVLFAHSQGNRLAVSDDRGATFHFLDLATARDAGVELALTVTEDQIVLHSYAGRVILFVRGVKTTDQSLFWQVMELDLATGQYAGTSRLPGGRLFLRGRYATSFSTKSPNGAAVASFGRIDLDTGALDVRSSTYALGPSVCLADSWVSSDGDQLFAICENALPEAGLCLLRADATTLVPTGTCIPRGYWPPYGPESVLRARNGGGVQDIYTKLGHTFAASLAPGAPPPVIQSHLALQQVSSPVPLAVDRERLGGLLPLLSGTGPLDARLVKWDGDGATAMEMTSIAKTPCADDARCFTAADSNALLFAYGSLVAALPLDGGDWLALHQVRDDLNRPNRTLSSGAWDYLVARRETPVAEPITDAPPDEPPNPLPGFPGSVAASDALEATCARLVACFPTLLYPAGGRLDLRACITSWLQIGTGDPAADTAYQRFVSTPPGDCAAFHDTWAQVLGPTTSGCGCHGDVAIICLGGSPGGVFDCRPRGLACILDSLGRATCAAPFTTTPTCNTCDSAGRATRCLDSNTPPPPMPAYVMQTDCSALGLVCRATTNAAGPICLVATPSCNGKPLNSFSCDGSIAYACTGSPTALLTDRRDCSRADQYCVMGSGCVSQASLPPPCPIPGEQCQGPYLAYCLGGSDTATGRGPVRRIDCTALGYSRCAMLSDTVEPHAACMP